MLNLCRLCAVRYKVNRKSVAILSTNVSVVFTVNLTRFRCDFERHFYLRPCTPQSKSLLLTELNYTAWNKYHISPRNIFPLSR